MGAPKQKWTSEEEAALKAGVVKHGSGKWRTILKDPEFSGILYLRSNVDLKDKWRNMSVTANGWGSREKARIALRRSQNFSRSDEDSSDMSPEVESDEEIIDANPLAVSSGLLQIAGPKQSISRLENLILEAITSLKEPSGSNKTNITMYIEDQYNTPPNFKRVLSAKLKALTATGKLLKVNRKYRIAPTATLRRNTVTPVQGRYNSNSNRDLSMRVEREDTRNVMKSQIDSELAKMRGMSVHEAAAAAAQAVAEAEAAMAEAEEAVKEADAAEADADAAQAFAEAAMTTLKKRYTSSSIYGGSTKHLPLPIPI